jgi:hypothetical protein
MLQARVELVQELVSQQLVIENIPLPSGIVVGVVIANTGEVKPFGMSKFIA